MICHGYGITLSQFFAEGEMVELTPELKELFDSWAALTPEQKAAAQQMIHAMKQNWSYWHSGTRFLFRMQVLFLS